MADYCTICFENEVTTGYDFDLYKIAKKLKKGYSTNFLCEGCDRRAIYKDENGEYELARDNGSSKLKWEIITIDSLKIKKQMRSWWHW